MKTAEKILTEVQPIGLSSFVTKESALLAMKLYAEQAFDKCISITQFEMDKEDMLRLKQELK